MLRRISQLSALLAGIVLPATAGSMRAPVPEPSSDGVSSGVLSAPVDEAVSADLTRTPTFAEGAAVAPLRYGAVSKRARRELILTFDDGPDLVGTPAVLAELERRGLRAIFFVNGEHMVGSRPEDFARRDLVRRIAAKGHLVANHTLSHRNVCNEPEALEQEIDGNAEIIAGATGLRPLLFRAPYGARCRKLDVALAERDLLSVGWNLDPQEWKGGSEDALVDYVTSRLGRATGRAVLLLHDTKAGAVRALPRILDWVEAENARLARIGAERIRIRDYSVFLPPAPPLPPTGLEPLAARLERALAPLWPGSR